MRLARRHAALEARAEYQGAGTLTDTSPPGVIGIDLGTTNTALAWAGSRGPVRLFEVPQLVASGEVGRRATLPSFLYFAEPSEVHSGLVKLPWDAEPDTVAGVFARDFGALVPARQISSAKSWLSNASVDRSAHLLPWLDDAVRKLSPVEASARLLAHLRGAWNHEHSESSRLERHAIVLTVPASFDEEARALTAQAALDAGLGEVALLEEPLAALYAWIAAHPRRLSSALGGGGLILVCDVGGGTTDFSLIRSAVENGELLFERIAIGEHLLLGGDNLDLLLAALVEHKLPGGTRLSLSQRQTLRWKCSGAKELLLSEGGPMSVPVTLLGGGRGIVGSGVTAQLTRDEVVRSLFEGFLPLTSFEDIPARARRVGLRELGLPYESEAAITKHLAAFLSRAARASGTGTVQWPDAVLFNGGFFTPAVARERVIAALTAWCGRRPVVLENAKPEAAVATGAAFYGRVRADPRGSRGLLIRAGSARGYYIGVTGTEGATAAVCVLPRGTQEGTRVSIDRDFSVVANQPSAFTLYSAMTRADPLNAVVSFAGQDDVHRHAPLVTALRYGKRSRRVPLPVRLTAAFTETGTLELWCESVTSEHRWRLSFNLRGMELDPLDDAGEEDEQEPDQVVVSDSTLRSAQALIRGTFATGSGDGGAPAALTSALENTLGHGKQAWPLPVLRSLGDVLLEVAAGRARGPSYEVRWLNLVGFCARPGFGAPLDPWRVSELRIVYLAGITFPKDIQCQVEWLVLWQRVAGGFNAGQQRELAQRVMGQVGFGQKKPGRLNPQLEREAWRLLGSLERLGAGDRTRIGHELLVRIRREPRNAARLWALGRAGARSPLYGPLNNVVPPRQAEQWLEQLMELEEITGEGAFAVAQIGAVTGDAARDVSEGVRLRAVQRLLDSGAPADAVAPLRQIVPAGRVASNPFGEPLPEGLRLEQDAAR